MAARSLSGLALERGASSVQSLKAAKEKWPYVWTAAPPGSEHVFKAKTVASPANNNPLQILSYQIPNNQRFVFRGMVLNFSNPNTVWTPGDGNITFSVTVNTPVGLVAAQGTAFKDYGAVTIPLGSFTLGPWPIEPGELSILESRSILRASVVINSLVIPAGTPNLFTAIFTGWTIPE
jgi:hypothetical protein